MSGGAWAAMSLLIGYLALGGVATTVALVRDERYGYATAAYLVTVLLAYMAVRAWSEALARWRRNR
jgi:hypothetical protein